MCLVKVHHDSDSDNDNARTYIRRRPTPVHSVHGSRIIIRPGSTSHTSTHRISLVEPAPRPSQYITASPGLPVPHPAPGRTSIPTIVHAPTPPRSPRTSGPIVYETSPRNSGVLVYETSPRTSRNSVRVERVARSRAGSVRSHHSNSKRLSRGREEVVILSNRDGVREKSRERRSHPRSREVSRERTSRVFLTTPVTDREVDGIARGIEHSRETMQIDDLGRNRSRSITYETNPRFSARTLDRQRVLEVDEDRRREYYRNPPSSA